MSKKLTMAIIVVVLAVVVIGVAVYYVSSNDDSKNEYTLSFESNGGSDVSSVTFDNNSPAVAPSNPTKSGSEFLGWYSDESLTAPFTFDEIPSGDTKLFAKWAELIDIDDDDWNEITSDPSITIWNIKSSETDSIAVKGSDLIKLEDYLEEVMLAVPNGCIILDIEDLRENNNITKDSVFKFSISAGNKAALSNEEADLVGDRPFYNVIFTVDDKNVSDPDDFIKLYLNYSLKDEEDPSKILVYSLSHNESAIADDTEFIPEKNLVECDPDYSSYYVIAYDGLLWPDMFGIDAPRASSTVEYYVGSDLFDLLEDEMPDDLPSEFLKYFDVSNLNWEFRSVSVHSYNESQFLDYVKSLKSDGFDQYPFSEAVSADPHTWIGIKSVDGVSYIIVASLNDMDLESHGDDSFRLYPLHEADLSVMLLNFNPLKEIGVSITKSESSSDAWVDYLAGFSIPAPYTGSGFENLVEIDFSGSSLSGFLDKITIKDSMSSEERKGFESFLNGLSSIKCTIGYIDVIDKSGHKLTYDAIGNEINKIKDLNGLKLVSATVDDGHYNSPVILAKTLEVANGKFTFEDLVIISFEEIEDDYNLLGYNPEMRIFAVNASISMNLSNISIPGFELNNLMFNEPWIESFAGFQFPEPYENAVIDYCMDMNLNVNELLNLLNAAFPDSSLVPEDILVLEESMKIYKDMSGDMGIISFTSSDFDLEAAKQFAQNVATANKLTIFSGDESDGIYSWVMAKTFLVASQTSINVEDLITVTWIPYSLDGKNMYNIQITSVDAKFTMQL